MLHLIDWSYKYYSEIQDALHDFVRWCVRVSHLYLRIINYQLGSAWSLKYVWITILRKKILSDALRISRSFILCCVMCTWDSRFSWNLHVEILSFASVSSKTLVSAPVWELPWSIETSSLWSPVIYFIAISTLIYSLQMATCSLLQLDAWSEH